MMHTGLDCFYSLIEENDLSPDEIEGVIVSLDPITVQPIWCVRKMKSDIDAQFSVPYVFAVAAHRIKIGPAWQHPRTLRDPKILDFMGRVKHQPHPLFDKVMLEEPGTNLAKVEIRARGKVFVEERKLMKGSPVSPATRMKDEDLIRKYKESAECSLPKRQIDQALALMLHLEKVKDISLLMSKLRPGVN
jgi:2-methylcitrate dehydratase PrpD